MEEDRLIAKIIINNDLNTVEGGDLDKTSEAKNT